jgi:hypothetical protein
MPEEKSLAERLHDRFAEKFGDDWRRDISLTLRADALYWFVYLAERGIEAKRQDFKGDKDVASAVASLASWQMDLENLLSKVEAVLPPKRGGKAKGK